MRQIYVSGRSQSLQDPDPVPGSRQISVQDLIPVHFCQAGSVVIQDEPSLQPSIERIPEGSHEWQDGKADRIERCGQAGKGRIVRRTG